MNRPNFRVKLDLCQFYRDVRRYCWVFIDGSKMFQISQMKEHVTKLFNVKEPFHLLLNETEYLPPNEDIRILKENETIVVSPGSGLEEHSEFSVNTTIVPESQNEFIKVENTANSLRHKESQTVDVPQTKQEPVNRDIKQRVQNGVLNDSQLDISGADLTFHSMIDDDVDSVAESKNMDSTITDDSYIVENYMPIPKKKRIRHRKSKKETLVAGKTVMEEDTRTKKPKIIDTCIISSGKHIRFDTVDNEEAIPKNMSYNQSRNGASTSLTSSCRELSNLLSLSQSSTPLTFTSRRVKEEVKVEHVSNEDSKMNVLPDGGEQNGKCINAKNYFFDKDLEAHSVLETTPRIKDVLAFKMLKLSTDYTPQVSEFIVGEVLSFCPKTSACTFHIHQGATEVQAPLGKFTLVQDEEERVMNDTITLNYSQLIEPRLLTYESSRTVNTAF